MSAEEEPLRCGQCEDADNFLSHLVENPECRDAAMREKLPQSSWNTKYSGDTALLILDLSLAFSWCLNTDQCSLPDGVIEPNARHLINSPDCFNFYKDQTVLAELGATTDSAAKLSGWLRNRRDKMERKKDSEDENFSQKMARQLANRCHKCGLQGPVMSKFEVKGEPKVCKKPLCEDESRLIDLDPRTLSFARGDASMVPGEKDHLVAVHVNDAILFMPAHAAREEWMVQPDEQIVGTKRMVVAVPNTVAAIRVLENATKRAQNEWERLKTIGNDTLAPRTMHLENFGSFIQAVSLMYRILLAAFRRSCLDKVAKLKNVATGAITSRSPMKTDASFTKPKFADVEPQAMEDTMPWSESAQVLRVAESEARSATNGTIKTKVRIRLLADDTDLWSHKLKSIIAKSFGRDVTETGTLTCENGCEAASCTENHPDLNTFVREQMSGLARMARIPLVLNYLKSKVKCFEKAVLKAECTQYDFKIEWDKFSWNVHLVGHMWSKRRQTTNEKAAKKWYPGEIATISRVLMRSEVLETVSLDEGLLQRRSEDELHIYFDMAFKRTFNRYGLQAEEAVEAVQLAKRHQLGVQHQHPVSLLDLWSPSRNLQYTTDHDKRLRETAILEAMKLDNDVGAVESVIHISRKLMHSGLARCIFDKDWRKLICNRLRQLDEVMSMRNTDFKMLTLYHCLLWKTGDGWTYARSSKELAVAHAYHPKILVTMKDRMCSTTKMSTESLEDLNLENLEADFSAVLGSAEHWNVVGIPQFFAEVDQQDVRLEGPTSQKTRLVNVRDGNDWTWQTATERSDALNEPRWPGNIIREDFTRSNNLKKLYDIRPPELERMSFAQFVCMYRNIKRSTAEYQTIEELIEKHGDKVGPRCEKTMIAGTEQFAPKYIKFENDEIVRLREDKNVIIRLNNHDQALNQMAKVFLFGCWRRPERALLEEEIAMTNMKECDDVRLHLFPASVHACE